jgi:phosphoribosylformimino-5-aminoimidazole carboxamide ribotide isomerase
MKILPAIDLRNGQVVRLMKGDYDRQTVYGQDALAVARQFAQAGAKWIHVVDLDAARTGQRTSGETIAAVCAATPAQVELGGGIRDDAAVEAALALGVARVIIGSAALKDWPWFESLAQSPQLRGRVVLGLDARSGQLAIHGWREEAGLELQTVARQAGKLPLAGIIYTDIERDGTMQGPDLRTTEELIHLTKLPVVASGGMSSLKDVADCKAIGCAGVILGRCLYEGRVDLAEAIGLGQEG